jgi:uncharacterized membrane protein YhiD involved in acid resistance
MHPSVAPLEFVIRMALAMVLGAAIGIERQLRNHEAGLKSSACLER